MWHISNQSLKTIRRANIQRVMVLTFDRQLKTFIDSTQQHVEGDVRIKLFKGNAIVNGRQSPYTLYDEKLATYTKEDAFNQEAAVGFIDIFGLPTQVNAMLHGGYSNEQ